jgi:hypothetical protein
MMYYKLLSVLTFLISLTACEPTIERKTDVAINTIPSLIYTKHARCRMDCRKVDESEVLEILQQGHINSKKSKEGDKPCPSFAYEGVSHDNQHLRIVVAKCETNWKVVTCIDLETDYSCSCY